MWDWLFVDFVIAVAVFAVAAVFFWFFLGGEGSSLKIESQKSKDWKRTSKNCFLEYLKKDWISIAVVEKYLLKALAIPLGPVKVALSMMALGDV